MKGRRRARRAALQALYELDLTDHPLSAVMGGRRPDVFRSSLAGDLAAPHLQRLLALIEQSGVEALGRLDSEGLADALDLDRADADHLAKLLPRVAEQATYMDRIVRGVVANRDRLDAVIGEIASEWPVDQMAPVDRNILRMALWEIATAASPVRVAISEAVELARHFSGEGARRLVNGALGTFASRDRPLRLVEVPDERVESGESPSEEETA